MCGFHVQLPLKHSHYTWPVIDLYLEQYVEKRTNLHTLYSVLLMWPQKQRPVWQSMVSAEAKPNRPIAQAPLMYARYVYVCMCMYHL